MMRFVYGNRKEVTTRVLLAHFLSRGLMRAFDSVRAQGGELVVRYDDAPGLQAPAAGIVCIFSESGEAFEELRVGMRKKAIVVPCSEERLTALLLRESPEGCAFIDTKPNDWDSRPWVPSICRV